MIRYCIGVAVQFLLSLLLLAIQLFAHYLEQDNKIAGLTKDLSSAKTTMQNQRAELEARHRIIQQFSEADPSMGAFGDLIGNAERTIRLMNDSQFFEDDSQQHQQHHVDQIDASPDDRVTTASAGADGSEEASPPQQLSPQPKQPSPKPRRARPSSAREGGAQQLSPPSGRKATPSPSPSSSSRGGRSRAVGTPRASKASAKGKQGPAGGRPQQQRHTTKRADSAKVAGGACKTARTWEMVCPEGAGPGDVIAIAEGGGHLEITVPPGVEAGGTFIVTID